MTGATIGGLLFLLVMLIGGWWQRRHEKRLWNGGWCPHCLTLWRSFDVDSQGGRGYRCECKPTRRIWISYPGVD